MIPESFRRYAALVSRYNPWTLTGWIALGGAIYLLGTGFANENAYSFLLSAVGFSLLVVSGVITRLEARRARGHAFVWESAGPVIARLGFPTQRLINPGFRPLPFLRLHMAIRGSYVAGTRSRFHLLHDVSFTHEPVVHFGLRLPWSGTLHLTYRTVIRDLFGLSRACFGENRERIVIVRPAFISDRKPLNVEAFQGDENQNRMKSSDVERYFMREYIPGDRERDINWKASSRYSQLFTRISPVTQEKTQLITIFFRPYNSLPRDSIESLTLLDRSKSMLLYFLRSVKAIHPEYEFRLYVGNDLFELSSDEDIEQLGIDISGTHFTGYGALPDIEPTDLVGGAYVFTTSCDTGINDFLGRFSGGALMIYRCHASKKVEEEGVLIRLYDELDSLLPETLFMAKSRNTRRQVPIAAESIVTEESVEVRFG